MLQGKESKLEKTVAQNPVTAASHICATTDSRSSFMCSQ
jgi:hypothetical protein